MLLPAIGSLSLSLSSRRSPLSPPRPLATSPTNATPGTSGSDRVSWLSASESVEILTTVPEHRKVGPNRLQPVEIEVSGHEPRLVLCCSEYHAPGVDDHAATVGDRVGAESAGSD